MNAALWLARAVLIAVFVRSGIAKLVDPATTGTTLIRFGVPQRLIAPARTILPAAEIAVAVALALPFSASVGAMSALGLCFVFTVAIGASLARGDHAPCNCFGRAEDRPIGARTLIRNGVLASLAVLIVAQGSPDHLAWPTWRPSSAGGWAATGMGIALALTLVIGGRLLMHIIRRHGRSLERIERLEALLDEAGVPPPYDHMPVHGLAPGSPAPDFRLTSVAGDDVSLDALLKANLPLLLVFADAGCTSCSGLLPELGRWQTIDAESLRVAVIARGGMDENKSMADEHRIQDVLLQKHREVIEAYRAPGTPSAVLIAADGTIRSALAIGANPVRALRRSATS